MPGRWCRRRSAGSAFLPGTYQAWAGSGDALAAATSPNTVTVRVFSVVVMASSQGPMRHPNAATRQPYRIFPVSLTTQERVLGSASPFPTRGAPLGCRNGVALAPVLVGHRGVRRFRLAGRRNLRERGCRVECGPVVDAHHSGTPGAGRRLPDRRGLPAPRDVRRAGGQPRRRAERSDLRRRSSRTSARESSAPTSAPATAARSSRCRRFISTAAASTSTGRRATMSTSSTAEGRRGRNWPAASRARRTRPAIEPRVSECGSTGR